LLDILGFGTKLIDKLIPDPQAKAQAQLDLAKLQQSGELAQLQADTQLAQGQLDVNKIEASSQNLFVSGWRPFIGWCCGLGFLYQVIISPVGSTVIVNALGWTAMPIIDSESLNTVLFGLLGLGAYRTVEKVTGKV
jgi:hypothetical protein